MASKIDSKNSDNRLSRDKDVFVPSTALATSSSIAENRFGRKSRNMFFIRHTAHPKNLRFITACGGIQVCSMKEDNYNLPDNVLEQIKQSTLSAASINPSILTNQKSIENYISDPKYALKFDSNSSSYNQDLLKKYEKKIVVKNRKERILPPIRHWTSTYMLADDTKRWRMELNSLAKKVGIMTNEEVESEPTAAAAGAAAGVKHNDQIKIDSLEIRNVKSLEFQRSTTQVNMNTNSNTNNNNNNKHTSAVNRKQLSHDSETTMSSTKEDRVKTGRFNETRGSALASRKQMSSSRLKTSLNLNSTSNKNKFILCIEESEREMWLLQILCQILNTESMQDIQSWLVSSGHQEKEAMKELIQKALDGLNQSGRIDIEKFNITNINPNEKTTQVDFEQIKNSITSMIENNKNIQFSNNNNQINNQTNFNNENKPEEISINNNNNNTTTINNNSNTNTTIITAATNNSQINQTNIQIDLGNENLIARIKLEESKNKKDNNKTNEEEENPFACGSEFKSVSLINMDPYAYERSRTLSTFEHYLSRTTYFQKKLRNRLIIKTKSRNNNIIETPQSATITSTATATANVLKHRPASSVDSGNNELIRATSLEVLNNTISKKLLNKFNRIELVDLQSLKFKDDTITTTTTTTTTAAAIVNSDTNLSNNNNNNNSTNNEKLKTKKSAKKQENLQQQQQVIYPTNVKLKLETNKDSQVLTIEDN